MTVSFVNTNRARGMMNPFQRRTTEQVEHRYELMQQYRREIEAHNKAIGGLAKWYRCSPRGDLKEARNPR